MKTIAKNQQKQHKIANNVKKLVKIEKKMQKKC